MPEGEQALAGRSLSILRADPGLHGAGLSGAEVARAEARLRVPQLRLDRDECASVDEGFGLLVVDGIIKRTTVVAGMPCTELLGTGDLLQPRNGAPGGSGEGWALAEWRALDRLHLAVLDDAFLRDCLPWPQIPSMLIARVLDRAQWRAAVRTAIGRTRRTDDRLQLLFWHFAQRWGTSDADGIRLRLPVSHATLAEFVGARRPSVTVALGRLERAGVMTRPAEGEWLLRGRPPSFAGR